MDITPPIAKDRLLISGYGAGVFTLNDQPHETSLLLLPEKAHSLSIESINEVTAEELLALITQTEQEEPTELLLVGCGESMQPLPQAFKRAMQQQGIATETMETGAACRTYNVLLSEGRPVAALLVRI